MVTGALPNMHPSAQGNLGQPLPYTAARISHLRYHNPDTPLIHIAVLGRKGMIGAAIELYSA